MKTLTASLIVLLCIGLSACDNGGQNPDERPVDSQDSGTLTITGEVRYIDLEGGAWIIQSEDSTRYEPLNLAEKYREDGLRVRVVAEEQPEKMSFLQVGPIIEIKSIDKR